jgi:Zn finger protein HypA/HybF involved in hydrogenase expression
MNRFGATKENFEVFVENSTYARHNLKKRIIKLGIIDYSCACCGIGDIWNGARMPLILDHINGVNNDNRVENLRFVCSNCDSQLPTYKSRNRKK